MKSLLFVILFLSSGLAQAQKGNAVVSISYGDGRGQIKPLLAKAEMLGRYDEGSIRTFDVGLAGMMSKYASLQIGVSVINHRYLFTDFQFLNTQVAVSRSVNTLAFPIKLRFDILKYLFVSGGFLLNADLGKGQQTDVGVGIGA
ncbi:MAG: hypothetical protein ACQUHE_19065, partial [Bacteroidia bacterium]